jgi:Spy/CpxP family protein refolding chaperone
MAQPGNGDIPGRGDHRAKLLEELDLTSEQKNKIEDLRIAMQLEAIDMRADIEKLELSLESELKANDANRKAVLALADKINTKRGELQKMHIAHRFDVRSVLNAEQKKIFDAKSFNKQHFKRHKIKQHLKDHERRPQCVRGIRRFQ